MRKIVLLIALLAAFPPLSTDMRRKLVTRIKDLAEDAKISLRNIRRDANKAADHAHKDKTIGEDVRDDLKNDVQEMTKKYEGNVTEIAKQREKEVMEE